MTMRWGVPAVVFRSSLPSLEKIIYLENFNRAFRPAIPGVRMDATDGPTRPAIYRRRWSGDEVGYLVLGQLRSSRGSVAGSLGRSRWRRCGSCGYSSGSASPGDALHLGDRRALEAPTTRSHGPRWAAARRASLRPAAQLACQRPALVRVTMIPAGSRYLAMAPEILPAAWSMSKLQACLTSDTTRPRALSAAITCSTSVVCRRTSWRNPSLSTSLPFVLFCFPVRRVAARGPRYNRLGEQAHREGRAPSGRAVHRCGP